MLTSVYVAQTAGEKALTQQLGLSPTMYGLNAAEVFACHASYTGRFEKLAKGRFQPIPMSKSDKGTHLVSYGDRHFPEKYLPAFLISKYLCNFPIRIAALIRNAFASHCKLTPVMASQLSQIGRGFCLAGRRSAVSSLVVYRRSAVSNKRAVVDEAGLGISAP